MPSHRRDADARTRIDQRADRRDPAAQAHVGRRTVGDAGLRRAERGNFRRRRMHHVRVPHVGAEPAQLLASSTGRYPNFSMQ